MVEGVRLCDVWDIPVDRTSLPPWALSAVHDLLLSWFGL